jgi:hypothetical protein
VLLDLPDIDSHWQSHLLLTRQMLRHMLFPIWVVSVEKYADRHVQEMLQKVAAGNAPANFLFVVNKVDQLRNDQAVITDLRDDYATRTARTLQIDRPKVYMVTALAPDRYDLPDLRRQLGREKSQGDVEQSRALAVRQRDRSLAGWIARQDLPERAERVLRLQRDAEDLLRARVVDGLLERVVPAIARDVGLRSELSDRVLERRVARWPLVNLVHTLLAPLLAMAATVVRGQAAGSRSAVDAHLDAGTGAITSGVQAAFAQLRQTYPAAGDIYQHRRLWEDMSASAASLELRLMLQTTLDRQRDEAVARFGGSDNVFAALGRWLLTIGAVLWFPIVQPILSILLDTNTGELTINWAIAARAAVDVLSAAYLLHNAAFLLVYFLVLWLAIRWSVQKRVARQLDRWASGAGTADLNLSAQIIRWQDDLLRPARRAADRIRALADRAATLAATADRRE